MAIQYQAAFFESKYCFSVVDVGVSCLLKWILSWFSSWIKSWVISCLVRLVFSWMSWISCWVVWGFWFFMISRMVSVCWFGFVWFSLCCLGSYLGVVVIGLITC